MAKISSPFANPVLNKIASAADAWLAENFPGWTFRRFQLGTERVGFYVLNGPGKTPDNVRAAEAIKTLHDRIRECSDNICHFSQTAEDRVSSPKKGF